MYEQQIPTLPVEVQARWDDWCDARCKVLLESALGDLADFLGEEMGKTDAKCTKVDEEIAKLKKENAKLRRELSLLKKTNVRSANVDPPNQQIIRKA